MLEYLLIPALLGFGLGIDFLTSLDDDEEDDEDAIANGPVDITLADDVFGFEGTGAKEHVTGNALDNRLSGGEDNDKLSGLAGNDTLDAGDGNDRIFAGVGNDIASGGAGDDRIFLQDGDDRYIPQDGSDDDAGDDLIRGGAGNDLITDTQGSNRIFGDPGHDRIITVDGLNTDGTVDPDAPYTPDEVHAGYGNDTIVADAGDTLIGGEGEDTFVIATLSGSEGSPAVMLDFDPGEDLFSVVFLGDPPEDTTVEFVHDAEAGQLRAIVSGQELAIIRGLTAEDIPLIQTYVTSMPELLATEAP
ncbi:calcium-binding protein [Marimonas sp. MJW-29]|uniref:Calcium-binding protein n=1 Tax=Sulfitobacter sediminis TaxID=3234186 RepID=A0ABV3RH44_9RHOB